MGTMATSSYRYNPSYSAIKRHLGAYWTPGASLAVLGDGSYDLPQLCYDQGEITDITVIDADQALLDQLRGANILQRPHMKFVLRDLASRVFDASLLSFDMILDKGFIDGMLAQTGGQQRVRDMVNAARGSLGRGGCMLVISHGQPSDRLPLLTATDEPWARIQVLSFQWENLPALAGGLGKRQPDSHDEGYAWMPVPDVDRPPKSSYFVYLLHASEGAVKEFRAPEYENKRGFQRS